MIGQFNYVQGAQTESDSTICVKMFQRNIAGSLPDDIYMGGVEFQSLVMFHIEDRSVFEENLWSKAINSMFVPAVELDDRLIFIRPTEKIRVTFGKMNIYRFTHYLYIYYPREDRACLFEFTPLGG